MSNTIKVCQPQSETQLILSDPECSQIDQPCLRVLQLSLWLLKIEMFEGDLADKWADKCPLMSMGD